MMDATQQRLGDSAMEAWALWQDCLLNPTPEQQALSEPERHALFIQRQLAHNVYAASVGGWQWVEPEQTFAALDDECPF
jgi:hypothetical protein